MHPILMVDLTSQLSKIKTELNQAIEQLINSSTFINGPQVKSFCDRLASYTNSKHVIPCANGTDALQIALQALGLPSDSEIIVPTFNYIAAAETIAFLGYKPVFVEADASSFNLNTHFLEACITKKTKAIVVVHLFGQCCDMEAILSFAKKHNLYVIEDNAQSIGSVYSFANGLTTMAGTLGNIGTTSFFPSKNLGCMGDGGALFTQDAELAIKIKTIANHGQINKYYHDIIGINSRLDTLQAAILDVKLKYLDTYIHARQSAAGFYDHSFANCPHIIVPYRSPYSSHVFHQYTLLIKNSADRDKLKTYLESRGIPSMIYYPLPIHLQKAYQYLGYKKGDFPVAESLCQKVLSLPMHTELTKEQLSYISENVLNFFK